MTRETSLGISPTEDLLKFTRSSVPLARVEMHSLYGGGTSEKLPQLTVHNIVETLLYLGDIDHPGIPLGRITLGQDLRLRLVRKLQDSEIEKKLESASRHNPRKPMEQFIAGRLNLITNGMLSGKEASEQAENLLKTLGTIYTERLAGQKLEKIEITDILTDAQLNDARDKVESAWVNSNVINQLNPLTVSSTGMVCDISRLRFQSEDTTLALPQTVVGVLRSLKHEESTPVLMQWILNDILSPRREECILFLKAAVQISGLVDTDDLIEMCGGKFNLLPFKSLHDGINQAISLLETNQFGGQDTKDLRDVAQQLYVKYRQIALSEKGVQVSPREASESVELYEEIALSLINEGENLGLSKLDTAKNIAKVLEQIGTSDFKQFKEQLTYIDSQIADLVEREAVRRGLVENDKIQLEIRKETFEMLKNHPLVDMADINFKTATKHGTKEKLIRPNTKTIKYTVVTLTGGPFTEGHRSMIKRLISYIKYQEQFDPPEMQRFILLSPITITKGVAGYDKGIETTGNVYERMASIFLGLADLTSEEKDLIMITTSMPPQPKQAKNVDNSIRTLIETTKNKLRSDFGGINTMDIQHELALGSDEIFGQPNFIPVKARLGINEVVLVARHGHLIQTIESEDRLRHETGVNKAILTPDSASISSTSWRNAILSKNYYGIPVGSRDFLALHWSKEYCNKRKTKRLTDQYPPRFRGKVPGVGYFYNELLKDYPKVTNLNGGSPKS